MPKPDLSFLSALRAQIEAKSLMRSARRAAHFGGGGGGVIIDTRGRHWDPDKHPRDSRGRFIETGGVAQVWGGRRGRVVRTLGNGLIEMRFDDGSRDAVKPERLTMVSRPNGGRPVKDDGTKKARALVMAEDKLRADHPDRGDGVDLDDDAPDLPKVEHTPKGFVDGPEPDFENDGKDHIENDAVGQRGKKQATIIREQFESLDEVKQHWKDRAEHDPAGAERVDKMESPELSPEGEHVVARVDGKWQVFRADDGKPVAGHNGSKTLPDKPAALEKANELDAAYNPEYVRPTKKTKKASQPSDVMDVGDGYTLKTLPGGGEDDDAMPQRELYDADGRFVASTDSNIDSRGGWMGTHRGKVVKGNDAQSWVDAVKRNEAQHRTNRAAQNAKAGQGGRDQQIADGFWKQALDRFGGDRAKAAAAVRHHLADTRAKSKNDPNKDRVAATERINRLVEIHASRAELADARAKELQARQDAEADFEGTQGMPIVHKPAVAAEKIDAPKSEADAPTAAPAVAADKIDGPKVTTAKVDEPAAVPAKADAPAAPAPAATPAAPAPKADAPAAPAPKADAPAAPAKADAPAAPKVDEPSADAPKRPTLAADDPERVDAGRIRRYTSGRAVAIPNGNHREAIEMGRVERDPNNAHGFRAVHSDGTVLAGGTRLDAFANLADHHNGDATREWKERKRRPRGTVAADAPKGGDEQPKGADAKQEDLFGGTPERPTAAAPKAAAPAAAEKAPEADKAPAAPKASTPDAADVDAKIKKHRDAAEQARFEGDDDMADHHTGVADALEASRPAKAEEKPAKRVEDLDELATREELAALSDEDLDRYIEEHPTARAAGERASRKREKLKAEQDAKGDVPAEAPAAPQAAEAPAAPEKPAASMPPAPTDDLEADLHAFEKWAIDNNYNVQDLMQAHDRNAGPRELHDALGEINADSRTMEALDNLQERLRDADVRGNLKPAPESVPGNTPDIAGDPNGSADVRPDRPAALGDVPPAGDGSTAEPGGALPTPRGEGGVADPRPSGAAGGSGEAAAVDGAGARRPRPVGAPDGRGGSDGGRGVPDAGAGRPGQRAADAVTPDDVPGDADRLTPAEREEPTPEAPNGSAPDLTPTEVDHWQAKTQDDMSPSGKIARAKANIEALKVLRQMEAEGRTEATDDEKKILAKWGSWGALPEMFDEDKPEFADLRAELAELMPDQKQAEAASRTTLNAHYTAAHMADSMWEAMQDLGFKDGVVLEPGAGIGNFIGLAPAGAKMLGVELDPTTAAMAKALHPNAHIEAKGFQRVELKPNSLDAVIGNVPFSDTILSDPTGGNKAKLNMHDHFIVKAMRAVRPGGLVMVMTSAGSLDKSTKKGREEMHALGDFLGAVRLPGGAHKASAGTDVVTDVLVFRRRAEGVSPRGLKFLGRKKIKTGSGKDWQVNEYFARHPEHVIGKMDVGNSMYGEGDALVVKHDDMSKVPAEFRRALRGIADDAKANHLGMTPREGGPASLDDAIRRRKSIDGKDEGHIDLAPDGESFTMIDNGKPVELAVPKSRADEVMALMRLRDLRTALMDEEQTHEHDTPLMDELRKALNEEYDAYVANPDWGPINRVRFSEPKADDPNGKRRAIAGLPAVWKSDRMGFIITGALEDYNPETGVAKKAAIFHKRTVKPAQIVERVDNPVDAVSLSQDQTGEVNLDKIAAYLGLPDAEAALAATKGLVFKDPETDMYVDEAKYGGGDVRGKLKLARALAAHDHSYEDNVAFLEKKVQPDIQAHEIHVAPGAAWMSESDLSDFARETFDSPGATVLNPGGGSGWDVEVPIGSYKSQEWSVLSDTQYNNDGSPKMLWNAGKIFQSVIQQSPIKVTYTVDGKTFTDVGKTKEAQDKARRMLGEFREWIWSDPDRRDRLVESYNQMFNFLAEQDYSARKVTVKGLSTSMPLRPHQHGGVSRVVSNPTTLLAHDVGYGKTLVMQASSMKLRQLGLAQKPAHVVPNHMLEQYTREFLKAFPSAKILVARKSDLAGNGSADTRRKRELFAAKAANGDWDAVVFTHSAFELMPVNPDNMEAYLERELKEKRAELEARKAARGENGRGVKRLENALLKMEEKYRKKIETAREKGGVTFEQTGIDYLFVDEAHLFKNLMTQSRIPGAGISGSGRAQDIHMKLDVLRERKGLNHPIGTFATATPLSNSMTEAYTMTRFMRPDLLEKTGTNSFDRWAATFGEVVALPEPDITGSNFKSKSRFAKFANLPELLGMFREFADIKMDADLPIPALRGGKAKTVMVKRSDAQAEYIQGLAERAQAIEAGGVDPKEDNLLKVTSDGRKAALDMRLLGGDAGANSPKLQAAANQIASVWQKNRGNLYKRDADNSDELHEAPGALQLVFMDLGTPKAPLSQKVNQLADVIEPMQDAVDKGDLDRDEARKDIYTRVMKLKGSDVESMADNIELDTSEWDEDTSKAEMAGDILDALFPEDGGGTRIEKVIDDGKPKWSPYQQLKDDLIAKGVPEDQIRFIHDAKDDAQKAQLFQDAREGRIQVLIGSTNKMGMGTNVQDRVVALHHLDVPWRPADLQQRDGRALRQGNQNAEVDIFNYVTEGTFDSYMWQSISRKQKFINAAMKGDRSIRSMDDMSSDQLAASEIVALSTGNPWLMRKATAEALKQQLNSDLRVHNTNRAEASAAVDRLQREADTLKPYLPGLKAAAAAWQDTTGEKFKMTVGGKEFTKRADADAEIKARLGAKFAGLPSKNQSTDWEDFGELGGLKLRARYVHSEIMSEGNSRWFEVGFEGLERRATPIELQDLDPKSKTMPTASLERQGRGFANAYESAEEQIARSERSAEQARKAATKPFDKDEDLKKANEIFDLVERIIEAHSAGADEHEIKSLEDQYADAMGTAKVDEASALDLVDAEIPMAADMLPPLEQIAKAAKFYEKKKPTRASWHDRVDKETDAALADLTDSSDERLIESVAKTMQALEPDTDPKEIRERVADRVRKARGEKKPSDVVKVDPQTAEIVDEGPVDGPKAPSAPSAPSGAPSAPQTPGQRPAAPAGQAAPSRPAGPRPDDVVKVDPTSGAITEDPALTERAWIDHSEVQAGDVITVDGITGTVTAARNGGWDNRGDATRAITLVDADGKTHEIKLEGADQVQRHVTPEEKARLDKQVDDMAEGLLGDFPESDADAPAAPAAPAAPEAPAADAPEQGEATLVDAGAYDGSALPGQQMIGGDDFQMGGDDFFITDSAPAPKPAVKPAQEVDDLFAVSDDAAPVAPSDRFALPGDDLAAAKPADLEKQMEYGAGRLPEGSPERHAMEMAAQALRGRFVGGYPSGANEGAYHANNEDGPEAHGFADRANLDEAMKAARDLGIELNRRGVTAEAGGEPVGDYLRRMAFEYEEARHLNADGPTPRQQDSPDWGSSKPSTPAAPSVPGNGGNGGDTTPPAPAAADAPEPEGVPDAASSTPGAPATPDAPEVLSDADAWQQAADDARLDAATNLGNTDAVIKGGRVAYGFPTVDVEPYEDTDRKGNKVLVEEFIANGMLNQAKGWTFKKDGTRNQRVTVDVRVPDHIAAELDKLRKQAADEKLAEATKKAEAAAEKYGPYNADARPPHMESVPTAASRIQVGDIVPGSGKVTDRGMTTNGRVQLTFDDGKGGTRKATFGPNTSVRVWKDKDGSSKPLPSGTAPAAPDKPWAPKVIDQGPRHQQIVDPDRLDSVLFDVEKTSDGVWSVHEPQVSAGVGTMFGTRKEAMEWAQKYAHLRRDGKELPDAEGNFFDDADAAAAAAPSAPNAPNAPAKPKAGDDDSTLPSTPATPDASSDGDDVTEERPDDVDEAPAAASTKITGQVSGGDTFGKIDLDDMEHGLVLRGETFKNLDAIKATRAFTFQEVPGEKKRDGSPFKAWTATGTPEERKRALSKLTAELGAEHSDPTKAAKALPDDADEVAVGDEEFPPTPEQTSVIKAVRKGLNTVVRALAGTGKTTTLMAIARRMPDSRILYLAFNKAIQEEADKKFAKIGNTEARTANSLAFAAMPSWMTKKGEGRYDIQGRPGSKWAGLTRNDEVAKHLGINSPLKGKDEPDISPAEQVSILRDTVQAYAISADDKIGPQHVPDRYRAYARDLIPNAEKWWADLDSEDGQIKLDQDYMVKTWALSRPDLSGGAGKGGGRSKADVIFFDEAQDINPVLAKVVADQTMQKVYVGDSNQAIYGFRGAVDELNKIKLEADLPLTKSWRFGPQVAEVGNRFLQMLGAKERVEGGGGESKITSTGNMVDPDAVLTRSNGGMLAAITKGLEAGRSVGVPANTKPDLMKLVKSVRFLSAMQDYENAKDADHVDDAMVERLLRNAESLRPKSMHEDLAPFRTWSEFAKAAGDSDDEDTPVVPNPKVAMLYRIATDYTPDQLEDIVSKVIDLGDKKNKDVKPDLTVSTAHKSKGLEWDRVQIGPDFRGPQKDKKTGEYLRDADGNLIIDPEELRLAYVAVTRAKKELDTGSLSYVFDLTDENGGVPGEKPKAADVVKVDPKTAEIVDDVTPDLPAAPAAPKAPEAPAAPEADVTPSAPTPDVTPEVTPDVVPDVAPEAPAAETTPDAPAAPEAPAMGEPIDLGDGWKVVPSADGMTADLLDPDGYLREEMQSHETSRADGERRWFGASKGHVRRNGLSLEDAAHTIKEREQNRDAVAAAPTNQSEVVKELAPTGGPDLTTTQGAPKFKRDTKAQNGPRDSISDGTIGFGVSPGEAGYQRRWELDENGQWVDKGGIGGYTRGFMLTDFLNERAKREALERFPVDEDLPEHQWIDRGGARAYRSGDAMLVMWPERLGETTAKEGDPFAKEDWWKGRLINRHLGADAMADTDRNGYSLRGWEPGGGWPQSHNSGIEAARYAEKMGPQMRAEADAWNKHGQKLSRLNYGPNDDRTHSSELLDRLDTMNDAQAILADAPDTTLAKRVDDEIRSLKQELKDRDGTHLTEISDDELAKVIDYETKRDQEQFGGRGGWIGLRDALAERERRDYGGVYGPRDEVKPGKIETAEQAAAVMPEPQPTPDLTADDVAPEAAAYTGPDFAGMSNDDLMKAAEDVANLEDPVRYAALEAEMDRREAAGLFDEKQEADAGAKLDDAADDGWGGSGATFGRPPMPVTEEQALDQLYKDNLSVLERFFDPENEGGKMSGVDALSFMPKNWLNRLMEGNSAPANVIAKYVPEEATLKIWAMTPKEMRKLGFSHLSIPGTRKRGEVLAEMRDLTDEHDPKGLRHRAIEDLHDHELAELASAVSKHLDDPDQLEYLNGEQIRRSQLSQSQREGEESDRRMRLAEAYEKAAEKVEPTGSGNPRTRDLKPGDVVTVDGVQYDVTSSTFDPTHRDWKPDATKGKITVTESGKTGLDALPKTVELDGDREFTIPRRTEGGRIDADDVRVGDKVRGKRTDNGEQDTITAEHVYSEGKFDYVVGRDSEGNLTTLRVPTEHGPMLIEATPAGGEKARDTKRPTPGSDFTGTVMPDDLRPGDVIEATITRNGRKGKIKGRIVGPIEKRGFNRSVQVEDERGERHWVNLPSGRPVNVLERGDKHKDGDKGGSGAGAGAGAGQGNGSGAGAGAGAGAGDGKGDPKPKPNGPDADGHDSEEHDSDEHDDTDDLDPKDMTDDELDERAKRDDEEGEKAREEQKRRREMTDEEKKDDDEERRRRRRRRRRNKRKGHHRPRPRLPHMPHPHMPDPNSGDGHGGGKGKGDKPGAPNAPHGVPEGHAPGADPRKPEPTVGDAAEVEKALDEADAVRPIDADQLTPASHKPGTDLTPEERDEENAAIDAAFPEPIPGAVEQGLAIDEAGEVKPDHVEQPVWDKAQGLAAKVRQYGGPDSAEVVPNDNGNVQIGVKDPDVPGKGMWVTVAPGENGGKPGISAVAYGPDGYIDVEPRQIGVRLAKLGKAHARAKQRDTKPGTADVIPGGTPATGEAPSTPDVTPSDVTPDVPASTDVPEVTPAVTPDAPAAPATPARPLQVVDVPEDATRVPVAADEVKKGDIVLHPETGEPVRVVSVTTNPDFIRLQYAGADRGMPVTGEDMPRDTILTRVDAPEAAAADVTPADVTPDVTPTVSEPTPSAPSTPNTPAATDSAPSTPGVNNPTTGGTSEAPSAPEAISYSADGITPEQEAAMLAPGADGKPLPWSVTTADGRLLVGTPVAGPDGKLAGIETRDGFVEPVTAAEIRNGRPFSIVSDEPAVDVTPSAPAEPDASTPIPDGLSPAPVVDDGLPSGTPMPRNDVVMPSEDMPARPATPAATDTPDAPQAPEAGDVTPDEEPELNGDGALGVTRSSKPLPARPGGDTPMSKIVEKAAVAKHTNPDGSKKKVTKREDGESREVHWKETEAQGQVAAYVAPSTLQIGDYSHVEGIDKDGNETAAAGFLTQTPQSVTVRRPDGSAPEEMLAITVSDRYDGLGAETTVYVPLNRMAAMAPRPDMKDVPEEGWQMDGNRLAVRDNRMPDSVPTDASGKGLFPGSLVEDGSGRQGHVILTRGRDVTVVWSDDDRPAMHSGKFLHVVDQALPEGWNENGTKDGSKTRRPKPSNVPTPRRPKPTDAKVDKHAGKEVDDLTADLLAEIDELVKRIQARNLTAEQAEKEFKKAAEAVLKRSAARRRATAQRIANEAGNRPGLLMQIIRWLDQMAALVVRALLSLIFGFGRGFMDGWRGEATPERRAQFKNEARAAAAAGVPLRKIRDAVAAGSEDVAA